MTLWSVGVATSVKQWSRVLGRDPAPGELEPLTVALAEWGRGRTALDWVEAKAELSVLVRQIAGFFEDVDVWLTPTVAEPPPPLGTFDPTPTDPLAGYGRAGLYCPFTPVCNLTGQPAMSVPLFWNSEGLPVGTHFIGRYGEEATLLQLAAQLEAARPWSGRRPPALSSPRA